MGICRRINLEERIRARTVRAGAAAPSFKAYTTNELKDLLMNLDVAVHREQARKLRELRADANTAGLAKTLNRPRIAAPA